MKYIKKYLISFLLAFFFVFLTFVLDNFLKENERYKAGECNIPITGNLDKPNQLFYDKISKTLEVKILANCCTNISVKKYNNEYLILESGSICRCMCYRKISISDVSENSKIIFIYIDGKKRILSPNLEFCGFSTFGKCKSDLDCFISGCSYQVCQSKLEEEVLTTCEYRDCYNYSKFNLSCKCIDNMCQWT